MVLLDTGTAGTSREIYGEDADDGTRTGCYRCLKTPKFEGFDVNLVLDFFKRSLVQIFALLENETLQIALTFYGINFKIRNSYLF